MEGWEGNLTSAMFQYPRRNQHTLISLGLLGKLGEVDGILVLVRHLECPSGRKDGWNVERGGEVIVQAKRWRCGAQTRNGTNRSQRSSLAYRRRRWRTVRPYGRVGNEWKILTVSLGSGSIREYDCPLLIE